MKPPARIGLAALLLGLVFAVPNAVQTQAVAQDAGRPAEPADAAVESADGPFTGAVPVSDLVHAAAAATSSVFLYKPELVEGQFVVIEGSIARPESRADWFRLLGDFLWEIGLTYARMRDEQMALYTILPVSSAGQMVGPAVTAPADLSDDTYFGTLVVHLRHIQPAAMQRALLNLSTRPGGAVSPFQDNGSLLIQDRRVQLQRMYRLIQLLDRAPVDALDDGGEADAGE